MTKGIARKLEEFGNAEFSAPENAKRRRLASASFSVMPLYFAAFFLDCYFLVALHATLFSRVPKAPRDPRSKYRYKYMSNVEEFRPN